MCFQVLRLSRAVVVQQLCLPFSDQDTSIFSPVGHRCVAFRSSVLQVCSFLYLLPEKTPFSLNRRASAPRAPLAGASRRFLILNFFGLIHRSMSRAGAALLITLHFLQKIFPF